MTTDKTETSSSHENGEKTIDNKNNFNNSQQVSVQQQQQQEKEQQQLEMSLEQEQELDDEETLNLSCRHLEKLARAAPEWQLNTTTLILDHNHLQRLDNIHTFQCIEKLSVQHNKLLRMFQVSKLSHLKILNLSHNSIVSMEGLKELKLLTWLSLAGNNIQGIEQLHQNVHLEHLDLSANAISCLTDIFHLKNLKTLLLHKNRITTLRAADRFLPAALSTLTLNENQITELTDMSFLSSLVCLEQLTIAGNPAVEQPVEEKNQFDYRPYVINWCLSIRVLDGILVGAKESLKAEWMYSQSKGRHFSDGQHGLLVSYLVDTCPLHPDKDWQEDEKLNLILSKVQEHQSSLKFEPGSSPRGSSTLPRSFTPGQSPSLRSGSLTRNRPSSFRRRDSATEESPREFQRIGTPQRNNYTNVRSASHRSSPSPYRRNHSAPRATPPFAEYSVTLPRTLYVDEDDETPVQGGDLMSQSLHPEHLLSSQGGEVVSNGGTIPQPQNNVMTESCDPSLLVMAKSHHEAWSRPDQLDKRRHRPRSLHQNRAAVGSDSDDVRLEDLSDGETIHTVMTRSLHPPVLNPVPETLNSPDVPVAQHRRQRDDPLLYHHEMSGSISLAAQLQQQQQLQNNVMSKSLSVPKKSKIPSSNSSNNNNGYTSSSDVEVSQRKPRKVLNRTATANTNKQRSVSVSSGLQTPRKSALPNNKVTELKTSNSNRKRQRNNPHDHDESSPSESEVENNPRTSNLNSNKKSTPRTIRSPRTPREGYKSPNDNRKNFTRNNSVRKPQSSQGENYAPERYASKLPGSNSRPGSAPTKSRPSSSGVRDRPSSGNAQGGIPSKMTQSAITIQKNWKGHQTREKDENVKDLKQEIRSLRTDEHIKYLTKELQGAKQALEQERKLRALQMDAIKVLWKEVQMMDATKCEDKSGSSGKTKPSGSFGSKISSRSSEHSIAKLMETLEATSGKVGSSSHNNNNASQEPPLAEPETVKQLGKTCQTLQDQVEQLQNSLNGMMRFMSAMNSNMEMITQQNQQKTRHSSGSTTTTQDNSFQFYAAAGPGSLPPSMFTSLVEPSQQQQHDFMSLDNHAKWKDEQDATPTKGTTTKPPFYLKQCDIPFNTESENEESLRSLQNSPNSRATRTESNQTNKPLLDLKPTDKDTSDNVKPKPSQRPSDLPGLNEPKKPNLMPKQDSSPPPIVSKEVKEFALTLVNDLLIDSISLSLSDADLNKQQQQQQSQYDTDISLSLANEEEVQNYNLMEATATTKSSPQNEDLSQSSHGVETDSLDEQNTPKKIVKNVTNSS